MVYAGERGAEVVSLVDVFPQPLPKNEIPDRDSLKTNKTNHKDFAEAFTFLFSSE